MTGRGTGDGAAPDAPDALAAGHFTTVQVRDGLVQGRDLHLLRLRDASRTMYGGGPRKGEVRALVRQRLAAAGEAVRNCTLRILVRPVAGDPGPDAGAVFRPPFEYQPDSHAGTVPPAQRVDVEFGPPGEVPAGALRLRSHRGLREHPFVKHLATGPQLRAREAAVAAGFDDAVLVDADGRIAEGTFWNIAFWDGSVLTWPKAPALPGVTFWRLHMSLGQEGIPARRVPVGLGDLDGQRTAVALNSRGLREIASIDGHAFPGDPGFVARLRALLERDDWEAF